jgi:hypothetical protein
MCKDVSKTISIEKANKWLDAIVNKAIESSDDAFVGLCKIFAYIEKRGEEEGYEKVISDIKDAMASIKK